MNRIEAEKRVVRQMIQLYCRKHHGSSTLCSDCSQLLAYAEERLDRCPKGNTKTSCRKCTIHCYAPHYRNQIKQVMRQVGPIMLFHHPLSALRHLLTELLPPPRP